MIELPGSSRWHDSSAMIRDFDNLERNLRELRTVIAAICMQQSDKTFTVPFVELAKVPTTIQLEVAVDRVHGNFVFSLVGEDGIPLRGEPAVGEGTGLTGDDHVASSLGTDAQP